MVGDAVGADVHEGPFGEADVLLLLPVGFNAASGSFDEEEKSPIFFDMDRIVVVAAALLNPALAVAWSKGPWRDVPRAGQH